MIGLNGALSQKTFIDTSWLPVQCYGQTESDPNNMADVLNKSMPYAMR
jgi:hypothetical protein